MKIGVDFDDVIVHTMMGFEKDWNANNPRTPLNYNKVSGWGLAELLDVEEKAIEETFATLDYSKVPVVPGALLGILELIDDGHEVQVLSASDRGPSLRMWLNRHGLSTMVLWSGLGDKAWFANINGFDAIIDDSPKTLEYAVRLGIHAIRIERPWNRATKSQHDGSSGVGSGFGVAPYEHSVQTWGELLGKIRHIARIRRNKLTNLVASLDYKCPPYNDNEQHEDEDIIANEKGALQTDLKARFDLLPALAIARVAQVLHYGAEKYGKDNWRDLSVEECHNHTLGHAIGYNNSEDLEDLAHTACRALMTLELALAAWVRGDDDD